MDTLRQYLHFPQTLNLENFLQDIFDENGSLIGKLRCQMLYELVDPDIPDSSENSRSEDLR